MTPAEDFRLREWLVQPSLNRMSRAGESASLQPRFMDLLVHLAKANGRVVSKDEILEAVWTREFVSEGTLTHAIAVIRQALGDDVRKPEYIETIPTRGYRLIAPVLPAVEPPAAAGPAELPPPVRRAWTRRALALTAALAVGAIALWAALRALGVSVPGADLGQPVKVMVMPFQNLGPAASEYVALGITDDITTRLASVRGVVVSSRTSAASCAQRGRSSRQISEEFGVRFILEGTVRWGTDATDGQSLRVNAQLIRASDDTLLWGQGYRTDVAGSVEVAALIAGEAVRGLGVRVAGADQSRLSAMPTEDADAYQAYLCGMRYHELAGREQLGLAAAMFERAAKLDPTFALALARLSLVYVRLAQLDAAPGPDRLVEAEDAARRALTLRPALPEAHMALGAIAQFGRGDLPAALAEYRVAARELANDGELAVLVADVHRRQGRWEEARRELARVVDRDPSDYAALLALGDTLSRMRRYAEAEHALERATGAAPDRVEPYIARFWNRLRWDGDPAGAERILSEAPVSDAAEVALCRSYLKYLAREFRAAADAVARVGAGAVLDASERAPRDLVECEYLDAARDAAGVARVCASALAAARREGPRDPWRLLAAARAYAALGRAREAGRAAAEAADAVPVARDAYDGPACALSQAGVLARIGDTAGAVAILGRLLAVPGPVSVAWLRADPRWDPLRADARFVALVK